MAARDWDLARDTRNMALLENVVYASGVVEMHIPHDVIATQLRMAISRCEKLLHDVPGSLTEMNKNILTAFKSGQTPTTSAAQLEQRQSQFEDDLARRQTAFEEDMRVRAPPAPKFADDNVDEPIGEDNINAVLAEEIARRQLVGVPDDPGRSGNPALVPGSSISSLEARVRALEDRVRTLENPGAEEHEPPREHAGDELEEGK